MYVIFIYCTENMDYKIKFISLFGLMFQIKFLKEPNFTNLRLEGSDFLIITIIMPIL